MKTAITVVIPSHDDTAMHILPGHLSKTEAVRQVRSTVSYPETVEFATWNDYASTDHTVTVRHLRWVGKLVRRAAWGE